MTRFSHDGGTFTLAVDPPASVTLVFDQVSRKDGLSGLLRVYTTHTFVANVAGVVLERRVNLQALQTVENVAKALDRTFDTVEGDGQLRWREWLTELSIRTNNYLTQGVAPVHMAEVPVPPGVSRAELPGGLVVLNAMPMMICGDGEAGKSTLAAWIAGHLTAYQHRVLWLDWEEDEAALARKLHRLFPDEVPEGIYYHPAGLYGPIWQQHAQLRARIKALGITYLIVDSVAAAIAGADGPESASTVTNYTTSIRELGALGSLHLAHVAKTVREDTQKSNKRPSPFGSVFWTNFVRLGYFAEVEDEGEGSTRTLGLKRNKNNLLAKRLVPDLALTFTYDDDAGENGPITVAPARYADHFSERMTLGEKILDALRSGTRGTTELGTALGFDMTDTTQRGTFRKTLSRLAERGKVINLDQSSGRHDGRWALLSHRQDA